MKILYDLIASQPDRGSKFHGGGEYCKTVFRKIVSENENNIIEVVVDPKRDIDSELVQICKDNDVKVNFCKDKNELNNLVNNGYDKFYSALPYEYGDMKFDSKIEFIYTIHGLRGIEMPFDRYENKFQNKSIKSLIRQAAIKISPKVIVNRRIDAFNRLFNVTENRRILVASYHTKYSILNYFPQIEESQIEVLYSPKKTISNIDWSNEEKVLDKYKVDSKKYILLVSGDRWLKNNYRGVKALDKLFSQNRKVLNGIKVVLLGVNNKSTYENIIMNKEKFIIEGYKDEEELEILYKNAHLLLYPTLNEGFGYPPLEAMKYGTFIAVSAISSITEVCGDAVLYFNPYDLDEIRNRVLESFDKTITNMKQEKLKLQHKEISCKQDKSLDEISKIILA